MDRIGFASFNNYQNPPSNLFAGDYPSESRPIRLLAGVSYKEGHVIGKITSGANKGLYTVSTLNNGAAQNPVATADGSQVPVGILSFDVDATAGAQNASMFVSGEFDIDKLVLGAGFSAETIQDAFGSAPIFLKSVTNLF